MAPSRPPDATWEERANAMTEGAGRFLLRLTLVVILFYGTLHLFIKNL